MWLRSKSRERERDPVSRWKKLEIHIVKEMEIDGKGRVGPILHQPTTV
jgi:hypothetical protein